MPIVSKQTAVIKTTKPKTGGSILSGSISIADLEDEFIKLVIYGTNRVGKTSLACQFPKPLLLVALDPTKTGGAKSVRKVEGVQYVRCTTSLMTITVAKEVRDGATCIISDSRYRGKRFASVVFDGATSYQDIVLKELLGLSELPEQLNWGTVSRDIYRERSEKTREGLRPFLDLDCNVVVIAKERDHNPQDKDKPAIIRSDSGIESFFASDLGGATVGWLHDACEITRLYMAKETAKKQIKVTGGKTIEQEYETGRSVRRLRTMLHTNFAAGIRSENPDNVPEYISEPTYAKIKAVIDGNWDVAKGCIIK